MPGIFHSLDFEVFDMSKAKIKAVSAIFSGCMLASAASAAPVSLSEVQMDSVAAGGVEKVDGFVCPAIPTDAVLSAPGGKFFPIGDGYYSFHGPDVSVPIHATNGDGAGRPGGDFSTPRDTDYTAVWGFRP